MAVNAEAITAEKGFQSASAGAAGNMPTEKASGISDKDTGDIPIMESKNTTDDKAVKNTEGIIKDTYGKLQNDTSSYFAGVTDTGKLRFTMRNDYMFKAVFQQNQEALRALLASLLGRKIQEIREVRLENPIILGETVEDKMVILDIRVLLNNAECINIEMQVAQQILWRERTLVYVSRNFSDLNRGEEYDRVKPVVHIGILDFRLAEDDERFYSENVLTDRNTGQVYSEKLQLNVLTLKNIENATQEQRESGLYDWAKFFAASTWEELKMAALNSDVMQSAVVTMRKLTADDKVRLQCEARERYNLDIKAWQSALQREKTSKQKAEESLQQEKAERQKAEDGWQQEKAERQKAEDGWQQEKTERQKAEDGWQQEKAKRQKAQKELHGTRFVKAIFSEKSEIRLETYNSSSRLIFSQSAATCLTLLNVLP